MLEFARPGFLLAGALASLVPPVLHLIARHPPRRAALPTLRFLRPDPRLDVRLHRRPTDLLLLLLRSAWLLLLGLALAGPSWLPRRAGTVEVVLLDRGAGMAGVWVAAVDSVRGVLGSLGDGEGGGGTGGVELVLFDSTATRLPAATPYAALLDSLAAAGPGAGVTSYSAALRTLPEIARTRPDADSFRVTLVTRSRWEGWSAGLGSLREAVWPGWIRVAAVEPAVRETPGPGVEGGSTTADADTAAPAGVAEVLRGGGAGGEWDGVPYVEAALHSLGWELGSGAAARVVIVPGTLPALRSPAPDMQRTLLERARAGNTVVVAGALPSGPLRAALPWEWPDTPAPAGSAGSVSDLSPASTPPPTPGALVLESGTALGGAGYRLPGHPRPGSRLVAVWDDGRPAAVAMEEGAGCLVFLTTGLEDGELPLEPDFPELLERLLRGCATDNTRARDDRPLDGGGRRILAGSDSMPVVAASLAADLMGPGGGRPLGRWILLVALGIALLETLLAYRRRGA